jgi:hypothetical protein
LLFEKDSAQENLDTLGFIIYVFCFCENVSH